MTFDPKELLTVAGEPLERVLCVAAHPDDLDFGAGATTAQVTDSGVQVTYLICTRGDQGGFDDTPREQMPVLRETEQRAAAGILGVTDVRFLDGYRDGWLEPSHDLQRDIVRVIRQVQPQRIVMPSPERLWAMLPASHPDHLTVGEATTRAVYPAARNAFAYPELLADEGLEPWTVRQLWLMGHPRFNRYVVINDTFDRKVAALQAHVSQTSHMDDLKSMLREWGTTVATIAKLPEGTLAEGYYEVCIDR